MEYTRGRFGSSGVVYSRSEDGAELEPLLLLGIDSVARATGGDGGLDLTGLSVLVELFKLEPELLAPGDFRTEAHVVGCCALLCCNPAKGTNPNIEFASTVVFSAMSKFVATSKLT